MGSLNSIIYIYIYEANGKFPHTCFEDRTLFYSIFFLTEIAKYNLNVEIYKNLFLLFNEFWYYKYQTDDVLSFKFIKDDNLENNLIDTIENINIRSSNNKYNAFNLLLQSNKNYKISIMGIKIFPIRKNMSIGIYSPILHDFIFYKIYDISINNNIDISFCIKGEAIDLKFCIFAGIHGKTQNNSMTINKIKIFNS